MGSPGRAPWDDVGSRAWGTETPSDNGEDSTEVPEDRLARLPGSDSTLELNVDGADGTP